MKTLIKANLGCPFEEKIGNASTYVHLVGLDTRLYILTDDHNRPLALHNPTCPRRRVLRQFSRLPRTIHPRCEQRLWLNLCASLTEETLVN